MTAPAGAIVSLYVDLVSRVAIDDVIETQSGRRYRIIAVRQQQRGKHVGRQHLRCLVLGKGERIAYEGMQPDHPWVPTVHRIRWYVRGRGRR